MCFTAMSWTLASMLWFMSTPEFCNGHTDAEICMHMSDVGCKMVEECSANTEEPVTFEVCYERATLKCARIAAQANPPQSVEPESNPKEKAPPKAY